MGVLASGSLAGLVGLVGLVGPAGSTPLPGFLNSLTGPLDHYGYGAIALLLLLENIGIPVIPGELSLIAGAIFAGTGRAGLNIAVVGVVAVIAASVGAEIGYLIGRFAGRELILRYGKYVLIKPHHLDRAQAIVDRYGGMVVVIARFIVGLREANGIIAGIAQMRLVTFTIYNVIGACAWVATWVTIGYMAGDHIDTIYADINRYSLYLLIALAVVLIGYLSWRLVRRRLRSSEPAETTGTEETFGTQETLESSETFVAQEGSEPQEVAAPQGRPEPQEVAAPQGCPEPQESAGAEDRSRTPGCCGTPDGSGTPNIFEPSEISEVQEFTRAQGDAEAADSSAIQSDIGTREDSEPPVGPATREDSRPPAGPATPERSEPQG
jgi:membrane protein DedA with SNARE-associated domain